MQKQVIATAYALRCIKFMQTKEPQLLLTSISSFWRKDTNISSLLTTDEKFEGKIYVYNLQVISPHN